MRQKFHEALEYLACPKCGGDFFPGDGGIVCRGCGFSVKVKEGVIFCFEESDLPEKIMEKTMYGPETRELEKELSDKKSARLSFLKYVKNQDGGSNCLDFGCGSSRQVFDLADQFSEGIVFGSDFDPEPLEIAAGLAKKLGYGNIFLVQYRSAKLPFRNDVFDVVTSHQVLEHVPDPEESVREIHRLMKKSGVFEVDFPNGKSAGETGRSFFHKITKTKNPHISRIGLKRSKEMFSDAGFRIEKFQSVQMFTGPLSYFVEGLFLRYIMKRYKIWEVRKKYQSSFFFRILTGLERSLGKYFPRAGHAFEFILTKI